MGGGHKHRRVCPVTNAMVRSGAFDVFFCETEQECQFGCNWESFENDNKLKTRVTPDLAVFGGAISSEH